MRIEIAEPGRMTQTGSSLQRLIQNNNMPVLDLLVRESIQNSLDARKRDSKYVEVNFVTGSFDSGVLAGELESLTEPLTRRFGNGMKRFLAIRDSHTEGLTGVMDYRQVKDNVYGNLLKLVYEICKPQEAEGVGGSWGIGKTVYFRIGIGLVIYYSRIKKEDGTYESRLAASYVENETSPDAMIPVYKNMSKRGIAWWGEAVDENVTQPVTDSEYVDSFLSIFGIDQYTGEDTGTTIVIPYINDEELLSNNRIEYLNDQEQPIIPFWGHKIEDYISISTQRWYSPRLNNSHYQQGAYLRLRINGKGISRDEMEPVFRVVQSLYNLASYVDEEDILIDVEDKKRESITVRKYLEDTSVGVLAFAKVSRQLLGMNAPDNKPEPLMYFNSEIDAQDGNMPIVCFTRKPAMIVSYEHDGSWVPNNVRSSSNEEYIIGLFVLNSYNKLKNCPSALTLEEYVRKSEMADHTSWSDWSEGLYNPRIVSKIQSGVNKLISREFATVQEQDKTKINSGLGKMFGDILLPPEGFGKLPSPPPGKKDNTGSGRSRVKFGIDAEKVRYRNNKMIVPIILETSPKKKVSRIGFDILIDSKSKKIDINEWEEKMCLDTPFDIHEYELDVDTVDGQKVDRREVLDSSGEVEVDGIRFMCRVSKKGTCHGLTIVSDEPRYIKMKMNAVVNLSRKDVKPVFNFEKED